MEKLEAHDVYKIIPNLDNDSMNLFVDCGSPTPISNGVYTLPTNTTTYQSEARYMCNTGYYVAAGNQTLTCQHGGSWSGTLITCQIYGILFKLHPKYLPNRRYIKLHPNYMTYIWYILMAPLLHARNMLNVFGTLIKSQIYGKCLWLPHKKSDIW